MEIVTNQRIILYDIHNNLTTQEAKKGGEKASTDGENISCIDWLIGWPV